MDNSLDRMQGGFSAPRHAAAIGRVSRVSALPVLLTLAVGLTVGATAAEAQRKTSITERPAPAAPRPAATLGTIDGIVTDTTLRPLNAADVSVVGVGARVVTSENGRFRILQVPPGQYLLVVRRIGYAPTSGIIQVPDDTLRLAYTLTRSENMLDTVRIRERRVSLRMLGFEQRRLQGQGQFITQEDLERRGSPAAKDILRNVRGLQVSELTNEQFAGAVALSRREGGTFGGNSNGGACAMQIVLDGIVLPGSFNLDLLPSPKQLAGIEIYTGPATVPPQFGGNDRRCGLIAVWTRDGY